MIRLVIADDQTILRDGLKTILELDPGLQVCGMAANGREVVQLCEAEHPDVVLMDIRMPEMNGVEATKVIKCKYPGIQVLVLTTFDEEEYILEAMANGASGYLLKDIDGEKLIQAVKDAVAGNLILPGRVAAKLAASITRSTKKESKPVSEQTEYSLTDREKEICSQILKGLNNREIADRLFLSEGTVKNYISNIYAKVGVSDRAQAIVFFRDRKEMLQK